MKSLRLRLLIGTLFWIVLSLLVAGVGLSKLFQQHAQEQLYVELQLHLDQLTARIDYDDEEQLQLTELPTDPRFSKPLSGLYWQVNEIEDGQLLNGLRSRSLWDQKLEAPVLAQPIERMVFQLSPNATLYGLARKVELDGQAIQLMVAANQSFLLNPIAQFRRQLWLSLLVLGVGLILAAVIQVWMGIAPLNRLRQALQSVRDGRKQQLEGDFPQEIMPLVNDFNSVLEQNSHMVERAQTQAGNLAHALKTPLTVLANAAYAEPTNTLAELINSQVRSARAQVDYHLKQARAVASAKHGFSSAPVAEAVDRILKVIKKLYQDKGLAFELAPIADHLLFKGEQQDLEEMLGNLLDNAGKWAQSTIRVSASSKEDAVKIVVEDDGPGIQDHLKQQMLARGMRADERVQGSGLGLAIVSDLAEIYGGKLELLDSPLGGLRVELTLPKIKINRG